MAMFAKNALTDDEAYNVGRYFWFDAKPGKVYAGWEPGADNRFKKCLSRFDDLRKKWDERVDDLAKSGHISKAFDTTAGSVLIPTYLDPGLIDLTRQDTPFLDLLKRETMVGLTVNIQQITDVSTAQWLAEGATLTEQDEAFNRETYTVKYGYSIGKVTGQMQAAGRGYINDAYQESIRIHGIALRRLEEQTALLGSPTATGDPCVVDPNGYEGIFKIIRDYNGGANEKDLAGAASITLQDVVDTIKTAKASKGRPSLIVTDFGTYYDLKSQIQEYARYVNEIDIAWGINTYTIENIPVIYSHAIPSTPNEHAVAVLSMDVLAMRVLQDVTFEKLGKTIDADKFMLKVYEVFTDRSGGKFHASIVGGA